MLEIIILFLYCSQNWYGMQCGPGDGAGASRADSKRRGGGGTGFCASWYRERRGGVALTPAVPAASAERTAFLVTAPESCVSSEVLKWQQVKYINQPSAYKLVFQPASRRLNIYDLF